MKKIFSALILVTLLILSFGLVISAINEDEVNEYTAYANTEVSKMSETDFQRTIAYIEQLKVDGKLSYAAFAVGNHTGEFFHWTLDGTSDNTLFDMASATKPTVVTSLFLKAQSEGLLHWDDTLSMHFENVSEDKADIPLWRLLSHSSGFVARVSNSVLSQFKDEEDRQAAVVDYILSTDLKYETGTDVVYACNGYIVLGEILENVYGKSLDQLFLEKVAEPLGMENSGYKLFENATDIAKHQADPNRVNDDMAHFLNDVSGNAGLFSNILDMSAYAIAVANKLADIDVSNDVFDESVKNRTEGLGDSRATGWKYVDETYTQTGNMFANGSIGHTGHTGTSFFVDPETGLWVVLLTNANYLASSDVSKIRTNFHNTLAEELFEFEIQNADGSVTTKYGTIPENYADAEKYPFALFKEDKTFKVACTHWANTDDSDTNNGGTNDNRDVIQQAKNLVSGTAGKGKTAYIYLRRDYAIDSTAYAKKDGTTVKEDYSNISQIGGTVVVDLSGHELKLGSSNAFIKAGGKTSSNSSGVVSVHDTAMKFLNGTITLAGKNLIYYSGSTGLTAARPQKVFNFTFENIAFATKSGATPVPLLYHKEGTSGFTGEKGVQTNVTFNNCTFDISQATKSAYNLFVCNDEKLAANVTVNGGKIIATGVSLAKLNDPIAKLGYDSTVQFVKGDDENYMTLYMNAGDAFVNRAIPTDKGDKYFVRTGSAEYESKPYDVYSILDNNSVKYYPKMSITLASELVMNVYVPVERTQSFVFNGETYDSSNSFGGVIKTIGGEDYYLVTASLGSSEAVKELKLLANVDVGGTVAKGTFTFSIPKYATKVINNENATDVEKALVKDVLAYIKAAYIYFDADDQTEVANAIDKILGNYNNAFAKVEGTTDADDGLWGVVIVLDAKPAIRFVLPKGVTADGYTFMSSSTTLKHTVGTMTIGENTHYYAEAALYAYQMINEITYTDGINSGSYHINSYYDFVTTDNDLKNDANLIAIVEKLYNYCKSAEAYRDYVLDNCTHSYVENVKTEATPFTKGLMEYRCSICGDTYTEEIPTTLKILAVGNSFSVDAMSHLYLVAKDAGIENVVLGNLFIGGCSISKHLTKMNSDAAEYTFYVSDDASKEMVVEGTRTAKYGITYTDWDYITVQQASAYSGLLSYYDDLQSVIDYINANKTSDAEILWHMTWAYQQDCTQSGFANYDNDQATMYNSIVSVVNELILTNSSIAGVIPSGTAIQNLRTSPLGDTLTRDGYHLSYGIGRYTAALTWLAAITGYDVDKITATPSEYPEVNDNIDYIKEAVKNAIDEPYAVTESEFTSPDEFLGTTLSPLTEADKLYLESKGYDPDLYMLLDLSISENTYYDSTLSPNPYVRPSTHNLYFKYLATQIFTKDQLINGTLIRINDGYHYRAMGWENYPEKSTISKPDNVTEELTVIDDAWWGDYIHRAFNIQLVSKDKIYLAEGENFRIYVPVAKKTALTTEDVEYLTNLGLNAEEYMVLDYTYAIGKCYDSSKGVSLLTSAKFLCTNEKFTRYDITIGSVIRITGGYQYRPEGWTALNEKTSTRPAMVTEETVIVDTDWWGNWRYRSFNVTNGAKMTDAGGSVLRIYVKVA